MVGEEAEEAQNIFCMHLAGVQLRGGTGMPGRDLREMNREELAELLFEKQREYEEVRQQRQFVLQQTGRHLPGSERKKYDLELEELAERIDEIRELLQSGDSQRE